MTLSIKNLLLKSADLLDQKGWVQKVGKNSNGCCMLIAIHEVADKEVGSEIKDLVPKFDLVKQAFVLLKQTLDLLPESSLVKWNDDPSRYKEEVLAALRKTASILEH